MENIRYITIEFENCEWITFPITVFGECHLDNISVSIDRVATNAICKSVFAREIALEIFFPEAENKYIANNFLGKKYTIIQRFMLYRDITHIILTYQDDSKETFAVDYEDEIEGQLGSDNKNQKSHISECGNLYIIIDANKEVDDFFNMELINDKENMELKKDLYR